MSVAHRLRRRKYKIQDKKQDTDLHDFYSMNCILAVCHNVSNDFFFNLYFEMKCMFKYSSFSC